MGTDWPSSYVPACAIGLTIFKIKVHDLISLYALLEKLIKIVLTVLKQDWSI